MEAASDQAGSLFIGGSNPFQAYFGNFLIHTSLVVVAILINGILDFGHLLGIEASLDRTQVLLCLDTSLLDEKPGFEPHIVGAAHGVEVLTHMSVEVGLTGNAHALVDGLVHRTLSRQPLLLALHQLLVGLPQLPQRFTRFEPLRCGPHGLATVFSPRSLTLARANIT